MLLSQLLNINLKERIKLEELEEKLKDINKFDNYKHSLEY